MKKRMIKEDIVAEVSEDTGYPRYVVDKIISSTLENIIFAMSKGNEVKFSGFGIFELKKRAERKGRNPYTNEAVPIPARTVPFFKAGKYLKDAVIKNN